MAQSAKDYAKKQLGELDLSYLTGEEDVANKTYNTTKGSLETNFNACSLKSIFLFKARFLYLYL